MESTSALAPPGRQDDQGRGAWLTSQCIFPVQYSPEPLKKAGLRMGQKTHKKSATSENGRNPPKIRISNGKSFFVKNGKLERLYCIWKNFNVSQHNCCETKEFFHFHTQNCGLQPPL
ncbi:hypothetical protein [Croceicoccus sediminis]|uniref:hypothetical protein n=1 Tax=Croceicoccus sediminis TaxID=2571150 RepID=UPI00118429F2|nr:hypothetical protein [Croceicoccus sediminis]